LFAAGVEGDLARARGSGWLASGTKTIEAIYENGVLKLLTALPLPEKTRVRVMVESAELSGETDRAAWLKLSEDTLTRVWNNAGRRCLQ
jgi:predicted DNA-binding antitoxin AbrB/MazE fold protein